MRKERIYLVNVNGEANLVRAASKGAAFRFMARQVITVEVATQDALVGLVGGGELVKVAQ